MLLSNELGFYKTISEDVWAEICRQDAIHGETSKPQAVWFVNVMEEIGEACEILTDNGETRDYEKELIQAAALICQMIYDIERRRNKQNKCDVRSTKEV